MRGVKLLLFAVLILAMPAAYARTIDSVHWCDDERCLEGTDIHFRFAISNMNNTGIIVKEIYALDMATNGRFSFYTPRGNDSIIEQGQNREFEFYSMIQLPDSSDKVEYLPCYDAEVFNELGIVGNETMCGNELKTINIFPLGNVECYYDVDCRDSEFCDAKRNLCVSLECPETQEKVRHRCKDVVCDAFYDLKGGECVLNKGRFSASIIMFFAVTALLIYMLTLRAGSKGMEKV